MMNATEAERIIEGELEYIRESEDKDGYIAELADALVPPYYNQIIAEWTDMPEEFNDGWRELGDMAGTGIYKLMSIDLYLYYEHLLTQAYKDIEYNS